MDEPWIEPQLPHDGRGEPLLGRGVWDTRRTD